jgi:hypothetical protein
MRITSLALFVSIGSISAVAQSAQQNPKWFECGFISDKFKGGKSQELGSVGESMPRWMPRRAIRHKRGIQTYRGRAGRQIATLFERAA